MVEIVRQGSFEVIINGQIFSSHNREDKAVESLLNEVLERGVNGYIQYPDRLTIEIDQPKNAAEITLDKVTIK